ncbi:hypothetical protein CPB84DRAFT_1760121 [Gymnopilus junonius]|uniref:F-box protein n=1 Tax=Gymnopilus junonius TaxID=109634 RepID=A0A9P5P0R0_GYMJU|nr:hypothetical protein CPB84DRAFT_1760121 [Gymnopilus junonius]
MDNGLVVNGEQFSLFQNVLLKLLQDIFSDDILSFSFLSDTWVLICDPRPLERAGFITSIDIRCDPGPISQPEGSSVPFSQDPAKFIIVVTFWLSVNCRPRSLIHFIPSAYLLFFVDKADNMHSWATWIPRKTRMLYTKQYPSDVWVCYVYGTKFVISERLPRGNFGYSARLFDFNQLALRRHRKSDSETAEAPVGFRTSNALPDVDASLPFRSQSIILDDAHDQCTVLCSEDHIIIVGSECREYRLLVL